MNIMEKLLIYDHWLGNFSFADYIKPGANSSPNPIIRQRKKYLIMSLQDIIEVQNYLLLKFLKIKMFIEIMLGQHNILSNEKKINLFVKKVLKMKK